jgi:hypothetical protein
MKVIYEGQYDVTGFKAKGAFHPLRRGENEVPDDLVHLALRIPGARLPDGVELPKPKPKSKAKPKATPKPVVVVDMQGDE